MSLIPYAFLGAALLATACSQFFLKLYFMQKKRRHLVLAIGLFVCIPLASYLALRDLSLSTVYVSTALTHLLVFLLAWLVLGEKITKRQTQGFTLIMLGILVFAAG